MPCNDVMDCTSISDLSAIDYIDTRDLKKLRRELQDAADNTDTPQDADAAELLKLLDSLADEVGEWSEGNTLIRCTEWEDYCEEMASDCGYLPQLGKGQHNPLFDCIDWSEWAAMVRQDYSECEIGGVDYLYRN